MTQIKPVLVFISAVLLANSQIEFVAAEFDWCSLKCNGNEHTMCVYKEGGPAECSEAKTGLSSDERELILHVHNVFREKVAKGKQHPQPPAANMHELVWDHELATVAQRWMDQCQLGLQHDKCRLASDGGKVGQNLGYFWSSAPIKDRAANLEERVRSWFDENQHFDKTLVSKWWTGDWHSYGHYTQLVWATTKRVGCGVSQIKKGNGYELKIGCNYGPAGNMRNFPVYKEGKPASDCKVKSKKYDGLCSS